MRFLRIETHSPDWRRFATVGGPEVKRNAACYRAPLMRRTQVIWAVLVAATGVAAVGFLAWKATGQPDRVRGALAGTGEASGAIRAPHLPAPAPARTTGAVEGPANAAHSRLAQAASGPSSGVAGDRAPASDPTKDAAPQPGPVGVHGVAAAHAAPLAEGEILARIAAGEPGMEVLASRLDLGTARVSPQWQADESWDVETYYRQMQAGNEVWSGPARWRFHVARETGFLDRPCFEVVITRVDGEEYPPSTAYVTRDGYRLAGLRTTLTQSGKSREVTWAADDLGVLGDAKTGTKAPLTIVPFDLPPIDAEARISPDGLSGAPPVVEGAGQARMPRAADLVGAGLPHLALSYESPVDGTLVHQKWSRADMRWPVESRTETTWSFRRKAP